MPATVRQLALQLVAVALVLAVAWLLPPVPSASLRWGLVAGATGICAGLLAWGTRQPVWWRWIHAGFLPLAWGGGLLHIDPGWFLAAFAGLLLVYRGAVTGRVPLYLSNSLTAARLCALADERCARHLIDVGAGVGTIAIGVARARPDMAVTGVENAPLTWLIGEMLRRRFGVTRVDWRYGSLWDADLGGFDLVYAFLSPEPMPALWSKARAEMRPGSMLVSNSFAVPDVRPSSLIEVNDRRGTRLYCYLI